MPFLCSTHDTRPSKSAAEKVFQQRVTQRVLGKSRSASEVFHEPVAKNTGASKYCRLKDENIKPDEEMEKLQEHPPSHHHHGDEPRPLSRCNIS